MSHMANHNAALEAEIASLKAQLTIARVDLSHVKARLRVMSEREWSHEDRILAAICGPRGGLTDQTGFSDGIC